MGSLQSKNPSSKKDQKKSKSKAILPSLSSNNDNSNSTQKSKSKSKSKSKVSKKKIQRGGDQYIPTYTLTTQDWHLSDQVPPYAVDLNAGINSYVFGRTTPNNDFVVATGLVNNCNGVEMVGGKKKKVKGKKTKKPVKRVKKPSKK
jgi:hypothetical protein